MTNPIILVVSSSVDDGMDFCDKIGVRENLLSLKTKYYSANVSVHITTDPNPSLLDKLHIGAVVVYNNKVGSMSSFSHLNEVKLYVSDSPEVISACIDEGFEQVLPSDSNRIIEALSCRVWAATNKSADLTSFEAVMSQMQYIRESGLCDSDRRQQAETLIGALYDLIGSDVDNDSE